MDMVCRKDLHGGGEGQWVVGARGVVQWQGV